MLLQKNLGSDSEINYSLKFETIQDLLEKMRFLYKKIFRSMPFTTKTINP